MVLLIVLAATDAFTQPPRNRLVETRLTSAERVLLLRNGQVLEGNITRTGDYYLVTRGTRSEVRLPAASVEVVCDSLEVLYQYRLAGLVPGNRSGHLELARWCVQHDLTARAADQVLAAFALDSRPEGIGVIEQQLRAAESSPEPSRQVAPSASGAPTLHDIEAKIAALPAGAVQEFATSVQPLLLNRCATSGCHGLTRDSEFQLLRPGLRQTLSRRMTHRNLFAALAYVDHEAPAQSRLLTVPSQPHAGRGVVFAETEQDQRQTLANWLSRLADQPVADLPTSVAKPPAVLLQTRAESIEALKRSFSKLATEAAPEAGSEGNQRRRDDNYVPRDPFDPEVFNRRFHGPTDESE